MEGLYDDVAAPALLSEEAEALHRSVGALTASNDALRAELADVVSRATAAETSVDVLARNASALFNTARLDVARKEAEVKTLRAA